MKSILDRWQVAGSGTKVIDASRQAFQAQASAEQNVGGAESELALIRKQIEALRSGPQPQVPARR